jgi:hypothetical protein
MDVVNRQQALDAIKEARDARPDQTSQQALDDAPEAAPAAEAEDVQADGTEFTDNAQDDGLDDEGAAEAFEDEPGEIEPPKGWDQGFAELPREAQERIVRIEGERQAILHQQVTEIEQRLADAEKSRSEARAARDEHVAILEKLTGEKLVPPDADMLDETSDKYDPQRYEKQRLAYERKVRDQQDQKEELDKLKDQQAEEQQKQTQAFVTERDGYLRRHMPDLLDAERGSQLQSAMVAYAQTSGLNPASLAYASGPELHILHKAMMWDRAKKKGPAKGRRKSSVTPGARRPTSKPKSELNDAIANFRLGDRSSVIAVARAQRKR